MLIPVFLVLPADDELRGSALEHWRGMPNGVSPQTMLPHRFELDRTYSAQSTGQTARIPRQSEALHPANAEAFVVRGNVEVEDPNDIPEMLDGRDVLADPRVDLYTNCLGEDALGTAADCAERLAVTTLHANGLDGDGVAIAVVDSGINLAHLEAKLGFRPSFDKAMSWPAPDVAVLPGEYPVGHGTMCAFAALLAAPRATLIDIPALVGTPAGGAAIGRRLSTVYQAIAHLSSQWSIAFTPSGEPKYKALIVTNSFGMYHSSWDFPAGHRGRYADNPQHAFTRVIASMTMFDQVDVVFAAGNCGAGCPDAKCQGVTTGTITGANAIAEVLTVGGCNLDGERVGYSSEGPGVSGMAQEKPDLVAYTHFLGSEALGPNIADKGTSTAAPLAAGCIAALRTALSPGECSPASLNNALRQSAAGNAGGNWGSGLGRGILDPLAAARALGLIPGF